MADDSGVVFPAGPDGRRSTAAVGRAVVADALRPVDPTGARAAEQETNWRAGYLVHFRRLVEAGLGEPEAARRIADAGLTSLHDRMRVAVDGDERPLATLGTAPAGRSLRTVEVPGGAEPERELSLPYRGSRLRGDDLARRLDAWVVCGAMEPSAADAVRTVAAHPEWLALPDRTVVVLGAGAEMGPLTALLRWGARVAGVDLPREPLWRRVLETAGRSAGTLLVPSGEEDGDLAGSAGVDLVGEVPAVAEWVASLPGGLVLGNYVYADGADNVRVSTAVDALTLRLQREHPDLALGFLATPTDVFAVPREAVEHSVGAYAGRSTPAKLLVRPLRTVSAGRLLQRGYLPGADPGVNDSLVPQQGPNYALAKRLQRWRATTARAAGTTVSMNVAPPTRTRSVVKNRALAAAYAGAHRFGVEVFEPATSNVLMAALLVHDLHTGGGPRHDQPWQDEAHAAVHGGLWRTAYAPRSALGLAAVLGLGAARG
ncbi:hypothetical protein [Blastococcus sp. TF02A-26]|uniref:hypothetical protein n=1 Tax=Blastococcus sp. TF02A-26 TaxID=2250577 RepID=UPI000DEB620B|nr:hypothetical protein [Blastococcus sp. TF02A-26]RBY85339.1 hypothetical protein DQ240_12180 [Blastococcus sp. TF02A-26]